MTADIQRIKRNFIPEKYTITDWENLLPYFEHILNRTINTEQDLLQILKDANELSAVISEDACWRQIRMTCDTQNKELEDAFIFFSTQLQPQISLYSNKINEKIIASQFVNNLPSNYNNYIRSIRNALELFREENTILQSEESVLAQQYGNITSQMTIEHEGQIYTLQQASRFLMSDDRELRKLIFEKISARRLQDKDELNELFDKLLKLRSQIAKNAGFENYRDYKFKELGRFDYSIDDCFNFHNAVKKFIVPIAEKILQHKKQILGLEVLMPCDTEAEPKGQKALEPYNGGKELLEKSIETFEKVNPFFADCLRKMKTISHLDLDSRIGKAPGGYNCPLAETGVPFIFMNSANTQRDLVTMMHEGGHAIHSFLSHNLELSAFKEYPMEIAELASMSMELFTMDNWDVFYKNDNDLRRAKIDQLEDLLIILPWIAIIDKFQHWLYTNTNHTVEERTKEWNNILNEFSSKTVDWSDFQNYRDITWQRQLHLYEVPFYYIEYGIAQLGAIAMWQQYKNNPTQAVQNYQNALALGYTKDLNTLYKIAGIEFNFSEEKIRTLSAFVESELDKLYN